MPRRWAWIGIGALLLAAAVVAALWALHHAPERLRAEAESRLAEAIGAPVALEEAGVSVEEGLVFEARGGSAGPTAGGLSLDVDRVEAHIDPLSLVPGRFGVDLLVLEEPTLRIARGEDGRGRDDGRGPVEALQAAASWLRRLNLPADRLELQRATFRIAREGEPPLVIRDVDGFLDEAFLTGAIRFDLRGRLGEDGRGGALHLTGTTRAGGLQADLEVEGLEVAQLTAASASGGGLRGRVSGRLGWRAEGEDALGLEVHLAGRDIVVPVAEGLALERPQLHAQLRAEDGRLHVRQARVAEGDVEVAAEGSVGLPLAATSPLDLRLVVEDAPLAEVAALVARLDPSLARVAGPLEAGTLVRLDADLAQTPRQLLAELRDPLAARGALALELELADVALRLGNDARLDALGGRLAFDGAALRVNDLTARYRGDPLPRLDAALVGLDRVGSLSELRCTTPPAVPPLPGFAELVASTDREEDEPRKEPGWRQLTVQADWVSHPALLCGLEQVEAELWPGDDGGAQVEVRRGVWAGLALQASGIFRPAAPDAPGMPGAVELEVTVLSPFEAMAVEPPRNPWAQGRFAWDVRRLGRFHLQGATGRFRANGDTAHLEELEVQLDPGGSVHGALDLALGGAEPPAYDGRMIGHDLALSDVAAASGLDPDRLTGTLSGEAELAGRLVRGTSPLAGADGRIELHARKGQLRRETPWLMAILRVSEGMNPLRERDAIPYETIDVSGTVTDGVLAFDLASLDGPLLRLVATGSAQLAKPHRLDVVLGALYFPTVDSLIDRVPVVRRMVLGSSGNLIGSYFALEGTWSEPKARLIPVKSLALGPAEFVLEDVPGAVFGGLKRISSALLRGTSADPEAEPEAEPAEEQAGS